MYQLLSVVVVLVVVVVVVYDSGVVVSIEPKSQLRAPVG